MKTTIHLALAVALTGATIHAEKLANGLEFRAPAGWTVKSNATAAVLAPPNQVFEPGTTDPAEIYILGMQAGVTDVRDTQSVARLLKEYFPAESGMRLVGAPQPFQAVGGSGYLYRYDAVAQNQPVRVQIYIVSLNGEGVAGLVAVARPQLMALREANLASVAASMGRGAAAATPAPPAQTSTAQAPPVRGTNGPLAAQWDQKLRGRKLYQFSSYNSGYGGGGYNSQKTLLLGINGNFQFSRSGSTSMYVDGANASSSSQGANQGRWRIYEQGGKAILELVSSEGTETITLTADGTKTLLNGNRWLVGD